MVAMAVGLSVCLRGKELVMSFVPCSACRAGAPCSACAFCLQAHFKQKQEPKCGQQRCLRDELTQQCKEDLLSC